MANTKLLREKINASGLKLSHISKEMGITRQALSYKLIHNGEWTYCQAIILKKMLKLSAKDMNDIFFAA